MKRENSLEWLKKVDESLAGPKISSKLWSMTWTSTKTNFSTPGQKKSHAKVQASDWEAGQCFCRKTMVGNKLNMRQQCILAVMKANSMMCCMNRGTVSRRGKMIILLCLALVRRYVVPCQWFWHSNTRAMTCRQATAGTVAWLGACSTHRKAEGNRVFSAWRREG